MGNQRPPVACVHPGSSPVPWIVGMAHDTGASSTQVMGYCLSPP